MSDTSVRCRAIGCLYGQAVGDALGTRYEFMPATTVQSAIDADLRDKFLPILGGGPFSMELGQVTGETFLILVILMRILTSIYVNDR